MRVFNLSVKNLDRTGIRKKVLETWNAEERGSGEHRYNVEICADGSRIYLLRPARLNKGCDFAIVSEKYLKFKNGKDKPPKHSDIFELIRQLIDNHPSLKDDFVNSLECVYNCEDCEDVLSKCPQLIKITNCMAERALKILKWMWIEQDITYWTGDGRRMLKEAIDEVLESLPPLTS